MEHSEIDDQDEASPPPSQPRRVRVERAEHPIPARKPEKSGIEKKIYTKPPIISYKRGKSLKDTLVRAKLWHKAQMRRD